MPCRSPPRVPPLSAITPAGAPASRPPRFFFVRTDSARQSTTAKEAVMRVIRAEAMGMCFGVRDALELVARLDTPGSTTIHGELVHNEQVVEHLRVRGFRQSRPEEALPETDDVVVTAHGISN